jgi:hypothetical protein
MLKDKEGSVKLGKKYKTFNIVNDRIDAGKLPAGIYLIEIIAGSRREARRIVLN